MHLASRMARLGTENAFTVLNEVQRLRAAGRDIVSLGIGDPDFDTPEHIRAAAVEALARGRTHYGPPAGTPELRLAVAEHLRATRGVEYTPEDIVITPGAKPILFHALMALCEGGDEVVFTTPAFPIYESVARFAGAEPVPLLLPEERDFRLDPDRLRQTVGPRTRLIILNSPNNPTGGVLSREDLEAVAEAAIRADAWVLADEIYSRFLFEGEHHSIVQVPGMKERTILLDGFSKTYAMTGWRLGYGAMPAALAAQLANLNTNTVSCTATFIQDAGVAALQGPQEPVRAMIDEFRGRRDLAIAALNRIPGVTCRMPRGAFYAFPNVTDLCRLRGLESAEQLQHALLHDAGVATLARSCFGERVPGEEGEYLRLSFATSRQLLEEGIRRIHHWAQGG